MVARIANITFTLHPNHDFTTEADHSYTDGSASRHVQLKVPGYQYDYYLLAFQSYVPSSSWVDPSAVGPGDVSRFLHDFYYPIYMNPPASTSTPQTGIAPDLA